VIEPKETTHKGYVEDIRVTLPSGLVAGESIGNEFINSVYLMLDNYIG
jgi:hypothetical protein